jgi:hypothetical protein
MSDLAEALGLKPAKPKSVKRVKSVPFVYSVGDKRIVRPNTLTDVAYSESYMKQFDTLFNRIGTTIVKHMTETSEGAQYNEYANNVIETYDAHYFTIRDKLIESLKKNQMDMLD